MLIPATVAAMFAGLAEGSGEWAADYRDIASAITQPGFLDKLQAHSPFLHALTRDTCSLTRMQGSNKINVVPPEAWAEIDCRILPDRPAEVFIQDIRDLLAGTGVEVEVLMAFTPTVSSTDTELYHAIEHLVAEQHPDARVVPAVLSGFTDSHFTRDLGITSYGFDPKVIQESEYSRIHGNDERVSVAAFRQGVSDLRAIVSEVVYDR